MKTATVKTAEVKLKEVESLCDYILKQKDYNLTSWLEGQQDTANMIKNIIRSA